MNTADVVSIIVFVSVVLFAFAAIIIFDSWRKSNKALMRNRLRSAASGFYSKTRTEVLSNLHRAQADARRRRRRESLGSLGYYLNRLDTILGAGGSRRIAMIVMAIAVFGLLLIIFGLIPFSLISLVLAVLVTPLVIGLLIYNFLLNRFNTKFIEQLPDALDMIIRASQAGIPVTQSIRNVGLQFEKPLGTEFRRMGDALLLGSDIKEVLDESVLRIELPDFSFFSVCVLLQRESGGSIVEALENLSEIIRARRDLKLKAHALTAEGRMSGNVIASLPFIIVGLLSYINPDYVMTLLDTDTGRTVLMIAGGMLLAGVLLIRHITNMKV